MRLLRYLDPQGRVHHGIERDGGILRAEGTLAEGFLPREKADVARRLAPIDPRQILCIGLNYRKHAEETRSPIPPFPVLFFKSVSALQNPGDPILLPRVLASDQVDYEAELAVVIGRDAKNVTPANALDFVFGYTAGIDVSARDWQKNAGGGQWNRGKTPDTFAPLGPVIVTADELGDPQALAVRCRVGGELLQDGHTSDMIFSVAEIVSFLSASTTLLAGTVILTGTPSGVGVAREPKRFLRPGETVEVEISRIGTLSCPVAEELAPAGVAPIRLP